MDTICWSLSTEIHLQYFSIIRQIFVRQSVWPANTDNSHPSYKLMAVSSMFDVFEREFNVTGSVDKYILLEGLTCSMICYDIL